jgi:hypothetical protein
MHAVTRLRDNSSQQKSTNDYLPAIHMTWQQQKSHQTADKTILQMDIISFIHQLHNATLYFVIFVQLIGELITWPKNV